MNLVNELNFYSVLLSYTMSVQLDLFYFKTKTVSLVFLTFQQCIDLLELS